MKQPDLGKKIAELRLAKGLTQGELAQKCNLSLRTVQRIESAEVSPRSYTIKLIFSALDYNIYDSFGQFSYKLDRTAYRMGTAFKHIFRYVLDLFNLKTHTMRKISILSVPFITVILLCIFAGTETKAQNKEDVIARISVLNSQLTEWFNEGKIDSVGTLYLDNACMIPSGYKAIHGRENIIGYYSFLYATGFRFTENTSQSLGNEGSMVIEGSIAVDRGVWKTTGLSGTYLTQWKRVDGKWYIENEMTNTDI